MEAEELIKKAHQEAHQCYATKEVHDWIDWFAKELKVEESKEKGTTKISDLIGSLTHVKKEHGDLKVVLVFAPFEVPGGKTKKESAQQDENIFIDTNHCLEKQVKPTELYIQNFPY